MHLTCNTTLVRLAELAAIAHPPAGRLPPVPAEPAWLTRAWWWPWTAARVATLERGIAEQAAKVFRA